MSIRGAAKGTELALVSRARAGDRASADRLLAGYRGELLQFCLRGVSHRPDAEDLVQDILLRAHRGLPRLRDDAAFPFWLYRIARNELWRYYRRKHLNPHLQLDERTEELLQDDSEEPAVSAAWSSLAEAIASLARAECTEDEFLVLQLVWQGWEPTEIAVLWRMSPNTVRCRLHRARKRVLARVFGEAAGLVGADAVREAYEAALEAEERGARLTAAEASAFAARALGEPGPPGREEAFRRACLKVARCLHLAP